MGQGEGNYLAVLLAELHLQFCAQQQVPRVWVMVKSDKGGIHRKTTKVLGDWGDYAELSSNILINTYYKYKCYSILNATSACGWK